MFEIVKEGMIHKQWEPFNVLLLANACFGPVCMKCKVDVVIEFGDVFSELRP